MCRGNISVSCSICQLPHLQQLLPKLQFSIVWMKAMHRFSLIARKKTNHGKLLWGPFARLAQRLFWRNLPFELPTNMVSKNCCKEIGIQELVPKKTKCKRATTFHLHSPFPISWLFPLPIHCPESYSKFDLKFKGGKSENDLIFISRECVKSITRKRRFDLSCRDLDF